MINKLALYAALSNLIREHLKKNIELLRPCRTACLLIMSGIMPNSIPTTLEHRIISEQNPDGGWVEVLDTMWALLYLKLIKQENSIHYVKGIEWLQSNRLKNGGWGRNSRDIFRIPITGRILYFLPIIGIDDDYKALLHYWNIEKESLTYKASFTILALMNAKPIFENIINEAYSWLLTQQNIDGGFAPWKDHPVGSDIYCTSIALLGLLSLRNSDHIQTIKKCIEWMGAKQLNIGLWPYHQIEDGGAWGLYAYNLYQKFIK